MNKANKFSTLRFASAGRRFYKLMKGTSRRAMKTGCAVVLAMVLSQGQSGWAGWSGVMNGTGYGMASVNVTAYKGGAAGSASSINMTNPSVAMTFTRGYVYGAPLPQDASLATVAKVKGSAGYVWQATTDGSNGDSTDNPELESRVRITAADCANLTVETSSVIDENTKTGTITVNCIGTAGTAIWMRGFELTGGEVPPEDDPNTPANEFIEFLKAHGTLKWDVLNVGPLDQNTTNCSALKIPFSYTTDITNLYSVSDGVAKSLPLVIECPNDIVVDCGQPVQYPGTVQVGGCGNITISFNPPAVNPDGSSPAGYFPVGTNLVTVTATDKDTNTISCTFKVIVTDTTKPVITATGTPANGVLGYNPTAAQINAALGTATASDNCGVGTPTAVNGSVIVNGCSRSQTRTWNVTDAGNNSATPVSRTATWFVDTTPPATPSLPTVIGSCGSSVTVTNPTTTDNCAGTVTGTTSDPKTYATPGTNIVHWTFSDGNGNSSTANQTVIVTGVGFTGFYSPIGTVSNSCSPSSVVVANQGSIVPIKFDMYCGTTPITTGTAPTVIIQPVTSNCALTGTATTVLAVYQNDWHFNWDTSGWAKTTYKVTVVLRDGTTRYVFIKLK